MNELHWDLQYLELRWELKRIDSYQCFDEDNQKFEKKKFNNKCLCFKPVIILTYKEE